MENKSRLLVLLAMFIFLFALIVLRLLDLQLLHHSFYEKKSLEQHTRIIKLAAQRGDIYDRNENILATSVDAYSVYLYGKGWLARKLSLPEAQKFGRESAKGIELLKEKKRVYPKGSLAAQVIGFVGLDNQGLSGVELAYDEYLRGKEGEVITEGDPEGVELYGALRELEPGIDGMNLTLTLDENIQYVAEREIEKQIKESRALSGMCMVMDVKSGEILALASKPDFDPNAYQMADRRSWHPRFLDPYEPGSTFKLITVAAGLAEGVVSIDTKFKAMDSIIIGGKVIKNSHEIDWPGSYITLSQVLEQSINTGAAQIGLKLGPEKFYGQIKAFGFGERTNFGMWGESKGIVRHWKSWYKPDVGMVTFGQSIAVTPLQLLSAISVFADDGMRVRPFVVKKIESIDGKFVKVYAGDGGVRVVSHKVADQMKKLMRSVVVNGTAKRAQIAGFAVCGKTGTAQKVSPGGRGYLKDHYISSFVGFAPMDDPRIAALVIVDDPRTSIWGEKVAAPVFKSVVEYTLRYINAKPDMF
jgi:stage V sporulation protein D (sporulation-specific penicillin-binding protein)